MFKKIAIASMRDDIIIHNDNDNTGVIEEDVSEKSKDN